MFQCISFRSFFVCLFFKDPITLIDEDCERVENIKELLRMEESGSQRKNLVQVYLRRVSS